MSCASEYTIRHDQRVTRGEDRRSFSPGRRSQFKLAQSRGLPQRPEPLPGAQPVLPRGRHHAPGWAVAWVTVSSPVWST